MESRSKNRSARAAVACATVASLALPSAAAANVPGQVTEVQNTVGKAIARALPAPKPPPAPVAPAPKPPAPAAKAPAPSPAARPAAPVQATGASTANAAAAGSDASTGQAAPADPKPAPARAARDTRTGEAPERADSTSRLELVSAGDLSADAGEESPSTLPFTGLPLLPMLAAGVLMLLAGIGVRRAVQ